MLVLMVYCCIFVLCFQKCHFSSYLGLFTHLLVTYSSSVLGGFSLIDTQPKVYLLIQTYMYTCTNIWLNVP